MPDCACGIGTQEIGLAAPGHSVTASDIRDGATLQVSKFDCEYRATRREELTALLLANGCREVVWKLPEETGFYQPVVIARK